jgi:hypothetical protein
MALMTISPATESPEVDSPKTSPGDEYLPLEQIGKEVAEEMIEIPTAQASGEEEDFQDFDEDDFDEEFDDDFEEEVEDEYEMDDDEFADFDSPDGNPDVGEEEEEEEEE